MRWHEETASKTWPIVAELSQQAMQQAPDNPRNWLLHADALVRLGRLPEAIAFLSRAAARFPDELQFRLALARAFHNNGEVESALIETEAYLRLAPDSIAMQVLRFELLVRIGKQEAANAFAEGIERSDPANRYLLELRAHQARRAGRMEDLLQASKAVLARQPSHTNATYYKALALAMLDQPERARQIMSTTRFVELSEPATPASYSDAEAFRAALPKEIRTNPTLIPDPRGKATRTGMQTRNLRSTGAATVEALIGAFKQAVDAYEQRLGGPTDGFAAARPRTARIDAWAIIFGADGHQVAHRHPGGWLSGVYYVSAPRPDGETTYRGPLVLGAIDPGDGFKEAPWETRAIQPVPGRLVMFPSYLPHATEPTGIDGERICVAFDVVPADTAAGQHAEA